MQARAHCTSEPLIATDRSLSSESRVPCHRNRPEKQRRNVIVSDTELRHKSATFESIVAK
jgi:hypothetical protein